MLRPRNVTDLHEANTVQLCPNTRIGRNLVVVDTHLLDILNVLSANIAEITGRCRDAQRVKAVLQHANDLIGAVLAATNRNDTIPIAAIRVSILRQYLAKFPLSLAPIDLIPFLVAAARIANPLFVEKEIGLRVGHDATHTISQHSYRILLNTFSEETK